MVNAIPTDAGQYLDEYDGPRFWEHVNLHGGTDYLDDPLARLDASAGECWTWSGWAAGNGAHLYGRLNIFGTSVQAHNLGYREFGGSIPEGMVLDHLCRNTLCVRHNHLEPVTGIENVDRGLRGRPANPTCKRGHPYDEANTRWGTRKGKPVRICRACSHDRKAGVA